MAHTDVLANPSDPTGTISVQLSVTTANTERSLPMSAEERTALISAEGLYFGNMFNLGDTTRTKGLYAGRGPGASGAGSVAPTEHGRRCFNDGCTASQSGITLFGNSGPYVEKSPDPLLQRLGGYSTVACTLDSRCATVNGGKTPKCVGISQKYCAPLQQRCTLAFGADGQHHASSGLDPSARFWPRVLEVMVPLDRDAESGLYDQGGSDSAEVRSDPTAMNGAYVTGLSYGGYVVAAELGWGSALGGTLSSYDKIRVRYKGSGSLKQRHEGRL